MDPKPPPGGPPVAQLAGLLRPLFTARLAVGCAALGVLWGGVSWGLARALPRPSGSDDAPAVWVLTALAGLFLTLSLLSLWTLLQRAWRPARALPTLGAGQRRLMHGQVEPLGDALVAPLSGRPCVAYVWRMHGWQADGSRWVAAAGVGAMAFTLRTARRPTAVQALPQLLDEPQTLDGRDVLARARRLVASEPFDPVGGASALLAPVAALATLAAVHAVRPGAPLRRNWRHAALAGVDLKQLTFDEVVLPLSADAWLLGNWSDDEQALVPSGQLAELTLAATGEHARQRLGPADASGQPQEEGPWQALVAAAITGAMGLGAVALLRAL